MGWGNRRLEPESSTVGQVLKVSVAVVLAAMMGLGAYVEFIPAPILAMRRVWLPLLLLGVGFTAWVLYSRKGREYVMSTVNGWFLRTLMVTTMPLLYSMMCWLALARGAPWLYTSAFGAEVKESEVMLTSHQHSRWSCDWRITGVGAGDNPRLCISMEMYERHPDQWVHVVLRGKRSFLGMSVQEVIVGDAVGEPRVGGDVSVAQMLRKIVGGTAY